MLRFEVFVIGLYLIYNFITLYIDAILICLFSSYQVKGEPNISYIFSRYYRAPELIFGATEYTSAIDI